MIIFKLRDVCPNMSVGVPWNTESHFLFERKRLRVMSGEWKAWQMRTGQHYYKPPYNSSPSIFTILPTSSVPLPFALFSLPSFYFNSLCSIYRIAQYVTDRLGRPVSAAGTCAQPDLGWWWHQRGGGSWTGNGIKWGGRGKEGKNSEQQNRKKAHIMQILLLQSLICLRKYKVIVLLTATWCWLVHCIMDLY